ncbi:hypothetical protein D3C85_1678300 [compost metagenome]
MLGLRLATDKTTQGDGAFFGFHRDIGAGDGFVIDQRTFNFSRCCAVIHVAVNFFHGAIDFGTRAISGTRRFVEQRIFSQRAATNQNGTQNNSHQ